jgi:hypothetical protein
MPIFTGYHGTDEHSASRIEQYGFEDSPPDSWLGPGIYFFDSQPGFNGLEDAKWWVISYKKYQNWVILKAEIKSDSVFDIFGDPQDRSDFGRLKQQLLKKHLESGGTKSDFNLKPLFLTLNGQFEVIRCLVDAARLDEFVNFVVGYPQIQICVTKSRCISKYMQIEAWS